MTRFSRSRFAGWDLYYPHDLCDLYATALLRTRLPGRICMIQLLDMIAYRQNAGSMFSRRSIQHIVMRPMCAIFYGRAAWRRAPLRCHACEPAPPQTRLCPCVKYSTVAVRRRSCLRRRGRLRRRGCEAATAEPRLRRRVCGGVAAEPPCFRDSRAFTVATITPPRSVGGSSSPT